MHSVDTAPVLGAGRFEVRGTLGAGGAGIVYRAFDHQLQREVALKLLRTASGRDLYRFKREFRALADIVHPNLVALHELHAAGDEWYFTMELVEGVSFIDWVRPSRTTGPARTRQDIAACPLHDVRIRGALVQLADALLALHKAGKLHRDLKPSNVLVTSAGRLALLDFGLVTTFAEANPERLAVGTPVYMSPEQASDQSLSEASDWYSVGAMLYEALTGRRPFEGDSESVMTRKQVELPADPSSLSRGAPIDLARLCMTLLQQSPAARPTGFAILDQLGAAPSARTRDMARTAQPASFVGRSRELEELRRALADTRRNSVAMMVRGKSGIGKTTLIRRFLRGVADQTFVLEGRCFEREQVPFKMLDGLVDMLTGVIVAQPPEIIDTLAPRELGSLVRLFPVMKRVKRFAELAAASPPPGEPAELRRRGFHALRAVIERLARIRPVVLFVDDSQWGDDDSAVFLSEMIHQGDQATLVILAHRPDDYTGVVARLKQPQAGTRRGDVRELEVGVLGDAEAIALAAQLATDSGRVELVVRTAGGNPLILTELARAPELVPGARVDDLVHARAARLSPDARSMLAVAAIAARPIAIEIAAHAAGVLGGHDEAAQLSAERLTTTRRVNGQSIIQPTHDHVRVAVLATLDVETKASWHESLARAFEDVQGETELDSQAVVEHWLAAGHPANAAHHAVTAAARAEDALAFRRAAELYEIALAYGTWDTRVQRDLLRKKAHALTSAGLLDEAAAVYAHAAELLHDVDAIDCERLRIEALLRRGRLDDALPAAERLLAQLGVRIPLGKPTSRARLAAQWVQQKLRGVDYVERAATECKPEELQRIDALHSIVSGLAFADPALGRVVQVEHMRAAYDCGEPVRVCLALVQEVCYAATAGARNATAVDGVGKRLVALAKRLRHPHLVGLADVALGVAAFRGGRWREARERFEIGLGVLHAHGSGVRWEIDIGQTYWLATLYYLGEWREMMRQGHSLLQDALDRSDVVAQLGIQTGRGAFVWLLANHPDDARTQLDAAEKTLAAGFHLPHVLAVQAGCDIDLYRGDGARAAQRLDEAWPAFERVGALRLQQVRLELLLLRARVALADTSKPLDDRLRVARTTADDVIKEAAPWAVGIGLIVRATIAAARGDLHAAYAALAAAEEQLGASDMVGWLQIARLRHGVLEGGPAGMARAAAARDLLNELGAADPDALADMLVPWPE